MFALFAASWNNVIELQPFIPLSLFMLTWVPHIQPSPGVKEHSDHRHILSEAGHHQNRQTLFIGAIYLTQAGGPQLINRNYKILWH